MLELLVLLYSRPDVHTPSSSEPQLRQPDPGMWVKLGGWLFRHRTAAPLPIGLALLLVRYRASPPSWPLSVAGVAMVALGELIRMWAVRHIGVISRTRSDRLGPLVDSGPFALVRNPLYLGNIALWTGFALSARHLWLAPLIIVVLGIE